MIRKLHLLLLSFTLVLGLILIPDTAHAATRLIFPVIGSTSFSNDYDAARGNEKHNATDIIAKKRQKIVSATTGTVANVFYPQPEYGYTVTVLGNDGYCYWYLHINNDNPGTDDGKGGEMRAYAPDIHQGNPIKRGQLIGWVGDSGNSEGTVSHLHFEILKAENNRCNSTNGTHKNPYRDLVDAAHISKPVDYPALPNELLPFNTWYRNKLNIARGNLTGTSADEIVVGTGYGQEPKIRVFNSSKKQIDGFYPSNTSATYGVDVALGDVDGDGTNEIVAGYRTGSSPKIAIFKKTQDSPTLNYSKIKEFTAFEGNTSPRVAVGDVNGDRIDEIISAKGKGSSPAVRIFDKNGKTLKTSFVVSRDFRGGLDIASGDVAGTFNDEIVVSVLTSGSSFIRVFDANFNKVSGKGFYAYNTSHKDGVYVSVGNAITSSLKAEILTLPNGGNPQLKYFDSQGNLLRSNYFMEPWWKGYYDVAAGNGGYSAATGGNRRGSIR